MVKNWELSNKIQFFEKLTQNIENNNSSISSIKLFKGLLKDEKDRKTYPQYNKDNDNDKQKELKLEDVIKDLLKNKGLIEKLLANLKFYYDQIN